MDTFADRVRSARSAAKLTQKKLAAASGLSQTTISDIERGRNTTSADIVALARALGVLAEWLADGRGPRTLNEATGLPPADPARSAQEPTANYLDETTIEARAKILAEQASEVSVLWMALPEPRRSTLLTQLRTESQPQSGEARAITSRRARSGAATPGTKGHQATG